MQGISIRRLDEAVFYEAPNHFDMRAMRLQGLEAGGPEKFWVGLSHFLPGGGAEMSASPLERVYVVLSGEVTVTTAEGATVLKAHDSCRLGGGETRAILNASNLPASMLVIMPYPESAR